MQNRLIRTVVGFVILGLSSFRLLAQNPPDAGGAVANDAPQAGGGGFNGGGFGTFPTRPPGDKAAAARGKKAYLTNCAYCHGEDARGGENGGPNLLRSEYLLKDRDGDVLRQFLLNKNETSHVGIREGVLKFGFTKGQASDIAAFITDISTFIHEFRVTSRDAGRIRPPTILVGDPKAGEAYFGAHCAACHSVTGDLKGIATRIGDPRTLQQRWLMPRVYGGRGAATSPRGVTVTVTRSNGQVIEGTLGRFDDFIVVVTDANGEEHMIDRVSEKPKVEVHDPMQPHRDLLATYTDKDIHDLTAWLVTIK